MNDFEKLMKEARETNRERDAIDRANEHAAPGDASLFLYLDTAVEAIKAGIITSDWSIIAEGLVMLEDIKRRMS